MTRRGLSSLSLLVLLGCGRCPTTAGSSGAVRTPEPRLARSEGALWATWFTAGEGQAGIYAAASEDGGSTFSARTLVAAAAPGQMVRHPELGTLPDGGLVVLYESAGEGKQDLLAQERDPKTGQWRPPRVVAPAGAYPRWAAEGKETAVAFTCQTGDDSQIVVADGAAAVREGIEGISCDGGADAHSGHSG